MSPHHRYIEECLKLAEQSPPRPTNFRVGAILLSRRTSDNDGDNDSNDPLANDRILSTGYTMELTGNTHAEQCCLSNYAAVHGVPDESVSDVLPSDEPGHQLVMYVTMEPCGKRLSGNAPCVQRIINTTYASDGSGRRRAGIQKVFFGVKEPGTFVGGSEGCRRLSEAGIEWEVVPGFEGRILTVATAGHESREEEVRTALGGEETNVDDISAEERQRQDEQPRNPNKRMMEG